MAAEVIRAGLLEIQVCVPKTFTDEQVEEFTNEDNPTGLESRWRIQREVEDNPHVPNSMPVLAKRRSLSFGFDLLRA